jgi:hypothetical protein
LRTALLPEEIDPNNAEALRLARKLEVDHDGG